MKPPPTLRFRDRAAAGEQLAELLGGWVRQHDSLILALPRGGVPVAAAMAQRLGRPFDLLVVRKLGVPRHEELAMGAIAGGGVRILNEPLIAELQIPPAAVQAAIDREASELKRRAALYQSEELPPVAGRDVIIVDDGLATGATMAAAIKLLRQAGAGHLTVAVPVAPADTLARLATQADEVVAALVPDPFVAVGRWYEDFSQTSDAEVQQLVALRVQQPAGAAPLAQHQIVERLRAHAGALTGAAGDLDGLVDLLGDARVVLLGEATHGTHEFYAQRAAISQRLITEKNFNLIAVEADWPDAAGIHRFIRSREPAEAITALAGFDRFPTWMWRNAEVLDFIGWLRDFNSQPLSPNRQVGFYGLDLYSLHKSMNAVIAFLEATDPRAAAEARTHYGCLDRYGRDPQNYGLLASRGLSPSCQQQVIRQLAAMEHNQASYAAPVRGGDDDAYFLAAQNARLVKNAEHYYRTLFQTDVSSWNVRDEHMFETLNQIIDHHEAHHGTAKVIVWAHNSHLGDARATEVAHHGQLNLGQLVRQKFTRHARSVGFTTFTGSVAAAAGWHLPVERMRIVPALKESYEFLFHQTGIPDFWLNLREPTVAGALSRAHLERAIGVVYHPHNERRSHYFHANLPDQFDVIIHFDTTRPVEPLDPSARWKPSETPETFPSGL